MKQEKTVLGYGDDMQGTILNVLGRKECIGIEADPHAQAIPTTALTDMAEITMHESLLLIVHQERCTVLCFKTSSREMRAGTEKDGPDCLHVEVI